MKYTSRQLNERKFHDTLAKTINIDEISITDAFSIGAQENRFARRLLGELKNKCILDLGCGYGETAVCWALAGATVYGVDISGEMVKLAQELAGRFKVSHQCRFRQMTAEKLTFSTHYFDFVFGNSVLHHVDLRRTAREINRVLKPGGTALFVEPLAYNPLIAIYRKLANKVRTADEKPLTFADIKSFKHLFTTVAHREYQFSTLVIFIWFFLVSGIHPNQERYWKKLLQVKGGLKLLLHVLVALDTVVLKLFPPLRLLCWNTVLILKK